MKLDSIYLVAMFATQLFIFSEYLGFAIAPDFLASYCSELWATLCALFCVGYPWLRRRLYGHARTSFASCLLRLATIFVVASAASILAIGFTAHDGFSEWQLGAFFVVVPSAIAGIICYSLSYGVFRLRTVA